MLNILTDPLIRFEEAGKTTLGALPEVYAALINNEVSAFPALRPHQRHAWHAFLVQLGAIGIQQAGLTSPPTTPEEWLKILQALTPDHPKDEPWQLLVEDITKPAFMQPPASSGKDFEKKDWFLSPDSMDMLDTAKNHDLKAAVGTAAAPEYWLYSLITMQTMNGRAGPGSHPIARMNSGDGSRTALSITPSLRPGLHIKRDITVLLDRLDEVMTDFPFTTDGLSLLWTEPWDGRKDESLPIQRLHPFHIEVCRRRRLDVNLQGQIYARRATTEARRIAAADLRGVAGDPWTLVDRRDAKGPKALTLQTDSFMYRRISEYITSADYQLPALYRPTADEGAGADMQLVLRGIRRTQGGQTEGYYERSIPIRPQMKAALLQRNKTEEIGDLSKQRIDQISKVKNILQEAIATFINGGKDIRDLDNNRRRALRGAAARWSNRLDERIDTTFFRDLQDEFELTEQDNRHQQRLKWLTLLVQEARNILHSAEDSISCPNIHRYRARVQAESLFEGLAAR